MSMPYKHQRLVARTAVTVSYTSPKSTRGGPSAISSALVPGRILLEALVSRAFPGILSCSLKRAMPGLAGPIWSSAIGGGEGRRGDDRGDWAAILGRSAGTMYKRYCAEWEMVGTGGRRQRKRQREASHASRVAALRRSGASASALHDPAGYRA